MNNGRDQIISKNKIHVFFKLPEVFWHQQAAIHNAVFCVGEKKTIMLINFGILQANDDLYKAIYL